MRAQNMRVDDRKRQVTYLLMLNRRKKQRYANEKTKRDVPEAPRLFVTGVTTDSMTLRWVIRSSSDVTGLNVHYRQEGWHVARPPHREPRRTTTYTLTNLHPRIRVPSLRDRLQRSLGRGDPSAILMVKTESSVRSSFSSGHESSAIETKQADDEVPLYLDMAIMIPAAPSAWPCSSYSSAPAFCVRKMKSTPRPVPEILRYDPATLNTGTMMSQRYVEMEKMSEQDAPFAAVPYEGGTMRNGTEMRGTLKERQEMKTYVPKVYCVHHLNTPTTLRIK
ncbi:hypothetical protein HPB48_008193 [Haemaphysalis longicornis]|uniref:Fibronectin type-III domain-containing protein n=1 Tax=Haemaphysalis longicornis TaxID=44386 RepID=A0A9J6H0Y2_HAELO|nr:hypothetical protein HPB48_008193 [Haemaphysalis longicornis]